MNSKTHEKFAFLVVFAFFTALMRIAGVTLSFFPMGFSPMQSVSLFSTRLIQNKLLAYFFPLLIIFLTDSLLNFYFSRHFSPFYPGFYWQYLAYFFIIRLGQNSPHLNLKRVIYNSFNAATLFFIISNFGVWMSTNLYSQNIQGVLTCYTMALPFYLKDIAATLFFSTIIFTLLNSYNKKFLTKTQIPIN